jgi:hypothetical protein
VNGSEPLCGDDMRLSSTHELPGRDVSSSLCAEGFRGRSHNERRQWKQAGQSTGFELGTRSRAGRGPIKPWRLLPEV